MKESEITIDTGSGGVCRRVCWRVGHSSMVTDGKMKLWLREGTKIEGEPKLGSWKFDKNQF